MRISTAWFQLNSTIQLQDQQAQLARTQEQVATGKRITQPSDDAIGSVRVMELGKALQQTDQYDRNANLAESRLQTQEGILDQAGNLMQRARDLTLQGANASQGNDSRSFIAAELREIRSAMLDAANTRDAGDNFIFAGYKSETQPFSPASGGVVYNGDEGQRTLQIGPNRTVTDGNPGSEVFMRIRQGNGVFKAEAPDTNTGTGVIKNTSVTDIQAWTPDDYEIEILANDQYEIRDGTGTVIQTGAYNAGETINFQGVEVIIEGEPAVGDTFQVTPSENQSVFDTLDRLITAFETPVRSDVDRAAQMNDLNRSLDDIDQAMENFLDVRSSTGARLKTIEDQMEVNDGARLQLKTTKSEIEDLDYAEAITRLNRQQVGLQAAQQAYVKTQNLSLFNFIG